MSVAAYPSDVRHGPPGRDPLARVRVDGGIEASFKVRDGATVLDSLRERGGYRLKFPQREGSALEAVIVNTGGGVAGGDRVRMSLTLGPGARSVVSTVGAERIYRSLGDCSAVDIKLEVGDGATLAWMPQATMLLSGARLMRRYAVDLAADATLVMAEATVFGRPASGEILGEGTLGDRWLVRRNGRLVFAEASRIEGPVAELLKRPAVAGGANAMALLVASAVGVGERCEAVRAALQCYSADTGVSAWNDLLVVRALASRLDTLQNVLQQAVGALQRCERPSVWPQ